MKTVKISRYATNKTFYYSEKLETWESVLIFGVTNYKQCSSDRHTDLIFEIDQLPLRGVAQQWRSDRSL